MGIPGPESVSTKQQRIAAMARQAPEMAFTSLFHHIDMDWLHEAYRRTRKDGAAGIDGQTAKDYAANLEENLRLLLDRAKSGDRYKAPPVRRVYIPKGDGGTRPLGIPSRTLGAPGIAGGLETVDGDGGRVGVGGGHQEVF